MAFRDWNGDGKKDMADDFIEYQIYKDVTKNSDDDSSSSNYSNYSHNSSDNSGCYMFFWIVVFLFIFSLISKCS